MKQNFTLPCVLRMCGFCFYPEYELKLGIDHSQIGDLLQVLDTIPKIDVWAIREQRASLKGSELIDPDREVDQDI